MTTGPPSPPEAGAEAKPDNAKEKVDPLQGGFGEGSLTAEKVDDLLDAVGDEVGAVPPPPLTGQQRAALQLAAGVFALILIALLFILWPVARAVRMEPERPAYLTQPALDLYRLECEHYTAMTSAAFERAIKLFQVIIASSLLPLLTGIIGYIFGRDKASS